MTMARNANHPEAPVHPGEMLREESMVRSRSRRMRSHWRCGCRQPGSVRLWRSIGADTAYRLARYFGMSVQFWMNLQSNYELAVAYRHSQDVIEKQVLPREAPAV